MPHSAVVQSPRPIGPPRRWREGAWSAACAAGLIAGLWFGAARGVEGDPVLVLAAAAQPEPKPVQPSGPLGWSMVVLQPAPRGGGQPTVEAKGFSPTASFTLR